MMQPRIIKTSFTYWKDFTRMLVSVLSENTKLKVRAKGNLRKSSLRAQQHNMSVLRLMLRSST